MSILAEGSLESYEGFIFFFCEGENFQSNELRMNGEGLQFFCPFFLIGLIGRVIGVGCFNDVIGKVECVGGVSGAHKYSSVGCGFPLMQGMATYFIRESAVTRAGFRHRR